MTSVSYSTYTRLEISANTIIFFSKQKRNNTIAMTSQ